MKKRELVRWLVGGGMQCTDSTLLSLAKKRGFDGLTADAAAAFLKAQGYTVETLSTDIDLKRRN